MIITHNKKGQVIILRIMLGVIIFIFAMAFAQPVKENFDIVQNGSNLNCTSSSLTPSQNATCITVDMGLFYFIAILIALSIAALTGKKDITGFATTVFVFVITIVMITPLKDFIILIRDGSHLSCGTAGLSTGANLLCLVADLWLFWFISLAIATAVTLAFNKTIGKKIFGDK